MKSGYYPVKAPTQRQQKWHLFRGVVSLCGMHELADLPLEQLEPAMVEGQRYCCSCQRKLAIETRNGWAPEAALSQADKAFIRAHWQTHSAREIAQLLGREVYQRVGEYGRGYCPNKTINAGHFRMGQAPPTAKPELQESLRNDNRGIAYWHVRGGKYGWQHKHVVLWEEAHGPVPKDKIVVFKDKNTLNCVLENLELITRSEHLGRNSGREALTDKYVAGQLARTGGQQGQHIDRDLQKQLLQTPEILEVKRNQLHLNRAIKQAKSNG